MLEESYARRTIDFVWLLMLASGALLVLSPFASDPFLGGPLSFAITYIWSRRNAGIEMSFLGLFNFSAAYLPLVLIGFSFVAYSRVPTADILGLVVGHIYYFLEDVWPQNPSSGGKKFLETPAMLRRLVGQLEEEVPHVHVD